MKGAAIAGGRRSGAWFAPRHLAAAMALAYLIDPETPKNDGTFRPLRVVAKLSSAL